jgi:hypothetical protein
VKNILNYFCLDQGTQIRLRRAGGPNRSFPSFCPWSVGFSVFAPTQPRTFASVQCKRKDRFLPVNTMASTGKKILLKILVLGESAVGKVCCRIRSSNPRPLRGASVWFFFSFRVLPFFPFSPCADIFLPRFPLNVDITFGAICEQQVLPPNEINHRC